MKSENNLTTQGEYSLNYLRAILNRSYVEPTLFEQGQSECANHAYNVICDLIVQIEDLKNK